MATEFEKLLENADETQLSNAIIKVIRKSNAKEFIDTLNKNFNESQKESFMEILCEYEAFLDKKNNEY